MDTSAGEQASFALLLRHYRRAAGLTQALLAERARLSVRGISDLERGINRTPRRETVTLLATALGLPPAERAQLEATVQRPRGLQTPPWSARPAPQSTSALPLLPDADATTEPTQPPLGVPPGTAGRGETRVLTVLCVDFAALQDTLAARPPDERAERTHAVLRLVGEIIRAHGGQTIRVLGADLTAYFGTPLAHENDPERAVLAALAVRTRLRDQSLPPLKAGIETGPVQLDVLPLGAGAELLAVGVAADVAAQLRAAAQSGQVLAGPAVHAQTQQAFTWDPAPSTPHGPAAPPAAHAVAGLAPHPQKTRGIEGRRAPVVGRTAELAALRQALAAVRAGHGHIVTLTGAAGVGKSRLIAELKDIAHRAGRPEGPHAALLWLEGRCLDVSSSVGYWPFLDMLRTYLALAPQDDDYARGTRLAATMRRLVRTGALLPDRAAAMLPLLANLLTARLGGVLDEQLTHAGPEQIRHQTLQALRDLFVAIARRQPLVLVLEDLHWADSLSLDLLALMMASASAVPLLLLCTVRPTREHRSRHLAALATRSGPDCSIILRLHDLSPAESRQLLTALVPAAALPATLTEQILTRAQGNPFFLEELVRALLDAGDLAHDGTTWRAREAHTLATVPVRVQSVILSRVDRLPAAARHVLHTAAVIGRLFRRRLLVAVLHSVAALDGALTDLEEGEFIYLERAFPDEEYTFQHVLVQETVYHTLARRHRAELHGEVAAALERLHGPDLEEYYEQLAYQYDQAGRADKAVPYLLKAGEKARRAYHTAEAEAFFQRALARLDTVVEGETQQQWRLAALTGLGQVSFVTGKMAEAEGLLRQAIALGRELELGARDLVHLYYWLAEVLFWQGRRRERIALGKDGLTLLGDETASVEAALMNATIGWGHVGLGEISMARASAARLGAFIRGVPYVEELLPSYLLLITMGLREKNVAEALQWAETFARLGEQHHDLRALANVEQLGFAAVREATGDLRAALAHRERACELYSQIGNPTNEAGNLAAMGRTFLALGDLQRAEERTRQAILVAERADRTWALGDAILLLGSVALARGAWEAARRHIDDARRLYDGNPTDLAWPAVYLGQIHLALGERTAALHDFETAFLSCQLDESMRTWDFLVMPQALRGLEEAGARAGRVRALVQRRRREHPRASTVPQTPCLERATDEVVPGPLRNQGAMSWAAAWTWHDPCGDCSYSMQEQGIVVRAANGRTLWHVNLSAPRLLQPAPAGEWGVQAVCDPVSAEQPAIGGLLLWQSERNYLVLERGHWGAGDIAFRGCLAGEDCFLGRGYLPGARVWLRLQRQGTQVRALCSADGEHWFTAGSVGFSRAEGEQVGLHAIGSIDRTIYHGAYPEGTAMYFTSVEVGGADAT